MKRYVVIGLGNFGASLAETLYAQGHDVAVLDRDEEAVNRISPRVTRAAVGDGQQIEALERLGAKQADAAVVNTGDDITASVLTTMALHDLGVHDIYVKVVSLDHARVMDRIGVTETVLPERESGIRLATRITSPGILNFVHLGASFGVQEMVVPDAWIGHTLRELELPRRYRIAVIAIHDVLSDTMTPAPDPDAPLKDSDTLLVAGLESDLERIRSSPK